LNTVPSAELAARASNGIPEPLRDFIFPEVDIGGMRADEWVMEVYLHASSEENYAQAKRAILAAVAGAKTETISLQIDYQDRRMPVTINDRQLVNRALDTIRRVVGEKGTLVQEGAPPYFGEDFGYYQKQIPGAFFWLGVSNPEKGIIGLPHAPFYQADDAAILVGGRVMANVLLDFLEQGNRQ
jgi:metal-dependent amidase/aminoacylase/carboxypeptidase family protein